MPRVSVCIPTYNRPLLVEETITSVLAQSYRDFEVVVVDDGSPGEETARVLAAFGERIRAFRQENRGIAGAKNACVEHARGDLIAFCDHDDLWEPGKLDLQVALMDSDPGIGMVYSRYRLFDERGLDFKVRPRSAPEGAIFATMLGKVFVQTSTVLLKRSVWEAAGPYDEGLALADDLDFFLRVAFVTRARCAPEPLVRYRVYPGNASRADAAPRRYVEEILSVYQRWAERDDLSSSLRRLVRKRCAKYHFNMSRLAQAAGDAATTGEHLARARRLHPFCARYLSATLWDAIRHGAQRRR